ncbi:MAG: GPR endopeptidase [Clostridiaceae bacterium]|nr:GPR endopeptidase [Clostridiaceae bacterium]
MEEKVKRSIRTDMADESRVVGAGARARTDDGGFGEGIQVEHDGDEEVSITRVHVNTPEGEQKVGKPMGTYITMDIPGIWQKSRDLYEKSCRMLARELERLIHIDKKDTVLVVGLGNWNVTADALGPRVAQTVLVTRHIYEYLPKEVDENTRPVCAISPGVLGITGIETGHIIKGIVDNVKPALVIAIDALASRNMSRVNASIQLANTGIAPGSGVGNKRAALTRETLGVPVIAIGVPTVVDAATMVSDTLDLILDSMMEQAGQGSQFYNMLSQIDRDEKYRMIIELLEPHTGNLVVTPKDTDEIVQYLTKLVANAINMALHENIGPNDVDRFIQ